MRSRRACFRQRWRFSRLERERRRDVRAVDSRAGRDRRRVPREDFVPGARRRAGRARGGGRPRRGGESGARAIPSGGARARRGRSDEARAALRRGPRRAAERARIGRRGGRRADGVGLAAAGRGFGGSGLRRRVVRVLGGGARARGRRGRGARGGAALVERGLRDGRRRAAEAAVRRSAHAFHSAARRGGAGLRARPGARVLRGRAARAARARPLRVPVVPRGAAAARSVQSPKSDRIRPSRCQSVRGGPATRLRGISTRRPRRRRDQSPYLARRRRTLRRKLRRRPWRRSRT